MNDLNKVFLIGRLTRDPEGINFESRVAGVNFSIANNKTYVKNDEKKEQVFYFDIVAWGKLGEVIFKYCKKGSKIAIEGELVQQRWENENKEKRSKIRVKAEKIQFLDNKSDNENWQKSDAPENGQFDNDDDIPF